MEGLETKTDPNSQEQWKLAIELDVSAVTAFDVIRCLFILWGYKQVVGC